MMKQELVFAGYSFHEQSTVPWNGVAPVYHCVYKLRQARNGGETADGLPGKSLRLFKQDETLKPAEEADTLTDALTIAERIALSTKPYKTTGGGKIHIDLDRQCWIILELDRQTNWRFSRMFHAVTTKDLETNTEKGQGFNADLRYIFTDDYIDPDNPTAPRKAIVTKVHNPDSSEVPAHYNCRVVVFRVARRIKGEGAPMNFFVEIFRKRENGHPQGKALELVPLIIDPQVPEEPPQSFP